MKPYPVLTVAKKILETCREAGKSLTPLQIIKLTYIAHGWTLALLDRPLVDERAEAWQYGPVLPKLYQAVKEYRSLTIGDVPGATNETIDQDASNIIDQVCELYGDMTGLQLSSLTHQKGTPWEQTWKPRERSSIIPDSLIKSHYLELKQRAQASAGA